MADDPKNPASAASTSAKSDKSTPAERAAAAKRAALKAEDQQKRQEAKVTYEKALLAAAQDYKAAIEKTHPFQTKLDNATTAADAAKAAKTAVDSEVDEDKSTAKAKTEALNAVSLELAEITRKQKIAADEDKVAQNNLATATKAKTEADNLVNATAQAVKDAQKALDKFNNHETKIEKDLVAAEDKLAELSRDAADAEALAAYDKALDEIAKSIAYRAAERL